MRNNSPSLDYCLRLICHVPKEFTQFIDILIETKQNDNAHLFEDFPEFQLLLLFLSDPISDKHKQELIAKSIHFSQSVTFWQEDRQYWKMLYTCPLCLYTLRSWWELKWTPCENLFYYGWNSLWTIRKRLDHAISVNCTDYTQWKLVLKTSPVLKRFVNLTLEVCYAPNITMINVTSGKMLTLVWSQKILSVISVCF